MSYSFHHGSGALFTDPDPDRIPNTSGIGTNEYGWGFYLSASRSEAYEYIPGGDWGNAAGFLHTWELDEKKTDEDVIMSHLSAEPFIPRVIEALKQKIQETFGGEREKYEKTLAVVQEKQQNGEYQKGRTLGEIACGMNVPLSPKEGAALMSKAGITGYLEGDYLVVYNPKDVHFDLNKVQAYGDEAQVELAARKEAEAAVVASVEAAAVEVKEETKAEAKEEARAEAKEEAKAEAPVAKAESVAAPVAGTVAAAMFASAVLPKARMGRGHYGAIRQAAAVKPEKSPLQSAYEDSIPLSGGKISGLNLASSELQSAARVVERERPRMAEQFRSILDELHQGKMVKEGGTGFDVREKIGIAVQQAVAGECDERRTNPKNLMERLTDLGVSPQDPQTAGLYQKIDKLIKDPELAPPRVQRDYQNSVALSGGSLARLNVGSDHLWQACMAIESQKPELKDQFRVILDDLHRGPMVKEGGRGYDIREMVGHAIAQAAEGRTDKVGTNVSNLMESLRYAGVTPDDPATARLYKNIDSLVKDPRLALPQANMQIKVAPPQRVRPRGLGL